MNKLVKKKEKKSVCWHASKKFKIAKYKQADVAKQHQLFNKYWDHFLSFISHFGPFRKTFQKDFRTEVKSARYLTWIQYTYHTFKINFPLN